MLNKISKLIRKGLYSIGIDMKFVRKNNVGSALFHNSIEARNSFYKNPKNIKKYLEKNRLLFYTQILEIIKDNNIKLDNKIIADFGCGSGKLFHFIKKEHFSNEFYGYDFSPEAINLAKKLFPKAKFEVHDIYKNLEKKFDIMFCTEVLEHLLHPELALNNLISIINSDSLLFVSVPDGRIDNYEGHINFWSPESWDVFIKNNSDNLRYITGNVNQKNLYALIFKK